MAEIVCYQSELENGYVVRDYALVGKLGKVELELMTISDDLTGRGWRVSSRWIPTRIAGRVYGAPEEAARAVREVWDGYRAWVREQTCPK